MKEIEEAIGLLAFSDPVRDAPNRCILTQARRVQTCDEVVFLYNARYTALDTIHVPSSSTAVDSSFSSDDSS